MCTVCIPLTPATKAGQTELFNDCCLGSWDLAAVASLERHILITSSARKGVGESESKWNRRLVLMCSFLFYSVLQRTDPGARAGGLRERTGAERDKKIS